MTSPFYLGSLIDYYFKQKEILKLNDTDIEILSNLSRWMSYSSSILVGYFGGCVYSETFWNKRKFEKLSGIRTLSARSPYLKFHTLNLILCVVSAITLNSYFKHKAINILQKYDKELALLKLEEIFESL